MTGTGRWKEMLIGVTAGMGGILAMRAYWQYLAPEVTSRLGKDQNGGDEWHEDHSNASILGKQHKENESAADALGRIMYQKLKGHEPITQESNQMMSHLVHWAYGLIQGGIYRRLVKRGGPISGVLYSTGLWLIGDEIIVPMLGLQPGPASFSLADHVNRLGAHWSYGLGTGISAKIVEKILQKK